MNMPNSKVCLKGEWSIKPIPNFVLRFLQGNVKAQGDLILQDIVQVADYKAKTKPAKRRVFVFEQMIIFSEPFERKKDWTVFIYRHSIKVSAVLVLLGTYRSATHSYCASQPKACKLQQDCCHLVTDLLSTSLYRDVLRMACLWQRVDDKSLASCQHACCMLIVKTGLPQAVSTSCNKSANDKCQQA